MRLEDDDYDAFEAKQKARGITSLQQAGKMAIVEFSGTDAIETAIGTVSHDEAENLIAALEVMREKPEFGYEALMSTLKAWKNKKKRQLSQKGKGKADEPSEGRKDKRTA